jgi:molybdopterin converting factor small subunit
MQVFVKIYGDLKRHAPGGRSHFTMRLDPGATLEDIQRRLSLPADRHTALVNGRRAGPDVAVSDGDTLVLLPLISGG